MELTFEPLQREDLAACYALCMQSFSESVPLEEVEQTFALCSRDPSYRLVVGKLEGRVVTYATLHFFHTVFDGMRPMATIWYVHTGAGVLEKRFLQSYAGSVKQSSAWKSCSPACRKMRPHRAFTVLWGSGMIWSVPLCGITLNRSEK